MRDMVEVKLGSMCRFKAREGHNSLHHLQIVYKLCIKQNSADDTSRTEPHVNVNLERKP